MTQKYFEAAHWSDKPEAWHEVSQGVRRRILGHASTGMMVFYKIDAGAEFPLHNHPHAQFGLFVEGSGLFRVGNETWKMKSGDTYFIPPGVMHELKTLEKCLVVDFFTPEREDYVPEALEPDG